MPSSHSIFYKTKNLQEVFQELSNVQGLQFVAGGTTLHCPLERSLSLGNVKELLTYDKHERYLDVGAAVTLSKLISLGKGNLPPVIYDSIVTVANESIRNIATIGGNICPEKQIKHERPENLGNDSRMHEHELEKESVLPKRFLPTNHSLWAPLLALDARLEFKNKDKTVFVPFTKFVEIPQGMLLTKIRISLDDWDISFYKRVGPSHVITNNSAGFVFMANIQNNVLSSVKIAFAGTVVFLSTEFENKLIGQRLPLSSSFIEKHIEQAKIIYEGFEEEAKSDDSAYSSNPILKIQFLNLLKKCLEML